MDLVFYFLSFIIGIIIGCLSFCIYKILRSSHKKTVGNLIIMKDDDNDQPYIFLEITNPEAIDAINNKYVELEIKNIDKSQK